MITSFTQININCKYDAGNVEFAKSTNLSA